MKIIKGLLWAVLALSICVGFALFYLLQPAGKVEQFAAWQYQPSHPTTSNNTTSETTNTGLKVHYFGVSTLLFDDGDSQILIDGFFSRPSLSQVMFSRLQSQPDLLNSLIQQHQLQRTRAILVTHSHYDHSLDLPFLAQQLQHSQIIGSNSSLNIARAAKIAETRLSHVNPAQPLQIGKFKITAIPRNRIVPFDSYSSDKSYNFSPALWVKVNSVFVIFPFFSISALASSSIGAF